MAIAPHTRMCYDVPAMLEKPTIADTMIIATLETSYALQAGQLTYLPLGADLNTAVYRLETIDGRVYFVKLRSGEFNQPSVIIPDTLADQGIAHLVRPLYTMHAALWANLEGYKLVLYPFIEGWDAYEQALTAEQWVELGATLRAVHDAALPPELSKSLPRESWPTRWRDSVFEFLRLVRQHTFAEPIAAETASTLISRHDQVLNLVQHTARLGAQIKSKSIEYVLCHADLHAGNLLLTANGDLYIVDWDTALLAPRERDLMYAGGGQMARWHSPEQEQAWFYQGYNDAPVDAAILAYYRYERIIEDIAVYCDELLLTDRGGDDRQQALEWLLSNFEPGGVLEIANEQERLGH